MSHSQCYQTLYMPLNKQTHDQRMAQLQCYQTVLFQPNKYMSSKCHNHNVIKQFIYSQTNKRPANVTITTLYNSLYADKRNHVQQMTQSQLYQTIYAQPSTYTTSKCQNHSVIKQFIYNQTNTRPVNVTTTTLSNNLYAAKQIHDQ